MRWRSALPNEDTRRLTREEDKGRRERNEEKSEGRRRRRATGNLTVDCDYTRGKGRLFHSLGVGIEFKITKIVF